MKPSKFASSKKRGPTRERHPLARPAELTRTRPAADADVTSDGIAPEILSTLAHRVQQDARMLSQLRNLASDIPTCPVADFERIDHRVAVPAGAMPVAAGGLPDVENAFDTTIIAIDPAIVVLKSEQARLEPGSHFVVGVEGLDGLSRYASLVFSSNETVLGERLLVARRVPPAQDLFRVGNLMPSLDSGSFRYQTGLSAQALHRWSELGVLHARLLDRIMVCPRCFGLPTVRSACEHCGSVKFGSERLMHHFACAYVGHVDEFDQTDELVCPKCLMRHLVAGTDFEYLEGPYQCRECNACTTNLALSCQCLHCDHRFELAEAMEQDLVGYDVDRLDLLDLVPDA